MVEWQAASAVDSRVKLLALDPSAMANAAPADAAHRPLGDLAGATAETEAQGVVARARVEPVTAVAQRPWGCLKASESPRAPLLLLRLSRAVAVCWAASNT